MQIIILFLVFLICLFSLFILSRHDFVLLRKNISVAQIFDIAAISLVAGFFGGRIFHILNSFNFSYFIPLQFLHVYKFPGFSFLGFFIFAIIALYFLLRKTNALLRIYDIFSLAFFPVIAYSIVSFNYPFYPLITSLFLLLVLIVLHFVFLQSHNKYFMKDGAISLLFFALFSLHAFLVEFLLTRNLIFVFSFVQWVSVIIFISTLASFFLIQVFQKNK